MSNAILCLRDHANPWALSHEIQKKTTAAFPVKKNHLVWRYHGHGCDTLPSQMQPIARPVGCSQQHVASSVHTTACVVYGQWHLHGTTDKDLEKDILLEANFWRHVLDRLIHVTLTLAMNNMPFRGHRKILGQMNSGNFLSIIELMAKYDPVLKDVTNHPVGSLKYLSRSVQNQLINILAKRVQKEILDEIQAAPFSFCHYGHYPGYS